MLALKEVTEREVWDNNISWEKFLFLRGMHDVAERLLKAPVEIEQYVQHLVREAKEKEEQIGNISSDTDDDTAG